MKRPRRSAFTLVELLVVITIIAMLVGMLLPAVNQARERGRQAQCMNNQKQVGLAIQQFEGTRKVFPGYVNCLGVTNASGVKQPGYDASWVAAILPQLDRNDLYKGWRDGTNQLPQKIESLLCPSTIQDNPAAQGPLVYVVNCGVPDAYTTTNPLLGSGAFNALEEVSLAYGVFRNYDYEHVYNNRVRPMSIDYITQHDGVTNTLMLSENAQADSWAPQPNTTCNTTTASAALAGDYERKLGIVWYYTSSSVGGTGINQPSTSSPTTVDYTWARPSSGHPGGVLATFCDGHTRFVRDDIDYDTYVHIMTPDSQKVGLPTVFDPSKIP